MHSSFEKTVNQIVNDTLNEIFTETATGVIYDYLEMNYKLKPEDIAKNPDTFKQGLEKFLSTGALAVEGIIVKRLYEQYEKEYENKEGWAFTDYIKELKQQIKNT